MAGARVGPGLHQIASTAGFMTVLAIRATRVHPAALRAGRQLNLIEPSPSATVACFEPIAARQPRASSFALRCEPVDSVSLRELRGQADRRLRLAQDDDGIHGRRAIRGKRQQRERRRPATSRAASASRAGRRGDRSGNIAHHEDERHRDGQTRQERPPSINPSALPHDEPHDRSTVSAPTAIRIPISWVRR